MSYIASHLAPLVLRPKAAELAGDRSQPFVYRSRGCYWTRSGTALIAATLQVEEAGERIYVAEDFGIVDADPARHLRTYPFWDSAHPSDVSSELFDPWRSRWRRSTHRVDRLVDHCEWKLRRNGQSSTVDLKRLLIRPTPHPHDEEIELPCQDLLDVLTLCPHRDIRVRRDHRAHNVLLEAEEWQALIDRADTG